ncbi:MAG: tellurite resistance TerB family protein [Verrucomicrobiota bacterium]
MAIDSFFKDLIKSPSAQGALGGVASGAVVSMLMNKKARKKLGKTMMTVGGTAAVAGLGYYAYQKWQSNKSSSLTPTPEPTQASPAQLSQPIEHQAPPPSLEPGLQVKIVLAMIAAASADGSIDREEMNNLFQSMNSAELGPEEKSHLTATLNNPPTAQDIATLATSPEIGVELYAASLAAIDLDSPAEDFYLHHLAKMLALDEDLVAQLHTDAKNV